jgi:predicted nucleic acid-binding protein
MTGKTFVDTNVLVYAHDVDDLSKYDLARDALRELWNDGTGVLSPQSVVLGLFLVTDDQREFSRIAELSCENWLR